jgi:hypothetical protein
LDQQVFTGNRVRLVAIITQQQQEKFYSPSSPDELPFALTNVRELVLQCPKGVLRCELVGLEALDFFKRILPNLDILDIGALAVAAYDFESVAFNIPGGVLSESRATVFRCTAKGFYRDCHFRLIQPYPLSINNSMNILREIHLVPFGMHLCPSVPIAAYCQEYSQLEQEGWFAAASNSHSGADWVLLQEYPTFLARHPEASRL